MNPLARCAGPLHRRMRLPFLRSKTDATPARDRKRSAAKAEPVRAAGDDAVAAARTRARRRLVGAVVLLAVGVIGFPVLFETQPRPLPLDTPIELPHRDLSPQPAVPARVKPTPPSALPVDAGTEVATAPTAPTSPADPAVPASKPEPAPVVAVRPSPVPAPAPVKPAAEPVVAAPAPVAASAAGGRYVVQVGAYTDAATLREARAKVEKLGLKTYTQVIENDAGKRTRVRLGPYTTRDEADAAAAKLKRAGLPANILTL